MSPEIAFVALFSVATIVALAARWLRLPYTVALVVAGLTLGSSRAFKAPHLTKELLYAVFLPGLLFEAAYHVDFKKFWQNKLAINSLAIPGLAVSVVLTSALLTPTAEALHFVTGFTFVHGLVFAALIASTDPIAVVGLFKSLGAPKRLAILVEGESLLNDGTAIVLFTLATAMALGGKVSAGAAVVDFVRIVGMGLLIGLGIGYAVSKVIQLVDDPMIEVTLTTVAAYGSFVAAEHFHYSGVIATVAAGMLCGNYAARTGMSPSTRIAVESFWEYLAFALNSIVFLLIGFEVHLDTLLASWKPVVIGFLAVVLARAVVVYASATLLSVTREKIPWSWAAVLTWGGLRGGLSMVLVLSLPKTFPHRELLINMAFGVVVMSILVQGMTMAPVLRFFKLVGRGTDELEEYEVQRGLARASSAALEAIESMVRERTANALVLEQLRKEYGERLSATDRAIEELHLKAEDVRRDEEHAARRHLLQVEKDAVLSAYRGGYVSEHVYEKLLADVDARLFELEAGEEQSAPPAGKSAAAPGEQKSA